MTSPPQRRVRRTLLVLAALSAAAPAAASASTWTVDDDRAQCPTAGFTTIQDAIDQAAPHDTVVICDGLYREQSTPPYGSAQSYAQPGSRNGLTITKPLTIRGAGADEVTIMPAPELGDSLAGTVPYLRDGGGNAVLGGIRRSVTVEDSLVTGFNAGGVLFDDSVGGTDGAATNTVRSNVNAYGTVLRSRIVGAKGGASVNQTGVQFHSGQRGRVTDSEIADLWSGTSGTARASVGVLLTDAGTGDDVTDPGVRALAISGTGVRLPGTSNLKVLPKKR